MQKIKAEYRAQLPQCSGEFFLSDGGIETTLIYREGLELPSFAAFDLLKNEKGRAALRQYFSTYAALAKKYGVGLILESATWRSNPEWGTKLGYSSEALETANRQAIALLQEIRSEYETPKAKMVISGCIGPRGDGYKPGQQMSAQEAEVYHQKQIATFNDAGVDLVTALTMTYPEEAIGITRAAVTCGLPVVISFTVETDGRLPAGQTLEEGIQKVDSATNNAPAYYMINCAHPTHFASTIDATNPWIRRIRGLRVNASKKSHAELDRAQELDAGNPEQLGRECGALTRLWPNLNVLGGCCGTDERHVEEMCKAGIAN